MDPSDVPPLPSERAKRNKADPIAPGTPQTDSQDRKPDPDSPVEEKTDRRDATTRVFENEDGSLIVDAYTTPLFYKEGEDWKPIDNTISADDKRLGWLVSDGNAWKVSFGPGGEGVTVSTRAGDVTMKPVVRGSDNVESDESPVVEGETAANQVGPEPQLTRNPESKQTPRTAGEISEENAVPDPGIVEYDNVWPGVNVRYELRSSGLKEEIILSSPESGSEFLFDVIGSGLASDESGSLRLTDEVGEIFRMPPPVVVDAHGDVRSDAGARYEIREPGEDADSRVAVLLDEEWLAAQPADAFPLALDPTLYDLTPGTHSWTFNSQSGLYQGEPFGIGAASGLGVRSAVHFPQYESYITGGYRVYDAALGFIADHTVGPPTTAISVSDLGTHPTNGSIPTTYDQIATGTPIGSVTDPPAGFSEFFLHVHKEMDRWVTQDLQDQWFGIRGTESGPNARLRFYDARLTLYIFTPPPPTYITNATLTDNQVFTDKTPTFVAQPISVPADLGSACMEFQITTSPEPGTGMVVSGFDQQSASKAAEWTVSEGALQEGVKYWAWVLTDYCNNQGDHLPRTKPPLPATGNYLKRFTLDLGLGEGGASPTDEVGAVPANASKPSEGAPNPSLPVAKMTVNLVDGNLSMAVKTKKLETLAGAAELGFTYNSLTSDNHGLRAEFFNDTNSSGAIDASDAKIGDRVDPTVAFDWGTAGKPVQAHDPAKALAQWTGFLTVPFSGDWQIGAISSDGARATIDGSNVVLDRWATHEPEATPEFGSTFNANPNTPRQLKVEWRNSSGRAVILVVLRHVSGNNTVYQLSPDYLSRSPQTLPDGWTFNPASATARWVRLQDRGTSVSVFAADGSAHEFVASGTGQYTAPITAPNDVLAAGDGGRFVLLDESGYTYTFRPDGVIESLVAATDAKNPAALSYGYSGSPPRLRTITDPVSGRVINLSYGGDAACPSVAGGLLCHIAYWDGTATTLTYNGDGRLIRLTNPGDVIYDFGYDAEGRVTSVRDPLALDAIAAGSPADATTQTTIAYYPSDFGGAAEDDEGKVWFIAQPKPTPTAGHPGRFYVYGTASDPDARTASVLVEGFSPTVGYAEKVSFDSRNRITERFDSAGLKTTYAWDSQDRMVSRTEPGTATDAVRTGTEYDHAGRSIKTYGPAPASQINATTGKPISGQNPPTTTRVYDGGINGLAASYWTNPNLAGGPGLHETGVGPGGTLDKDWGTNLPVTPGAGGWSARFIGFLTTPSDGDYTFRLDTRASIARVWVDDKLVVDHNAPEPPDLLLTTTGPATSLLTGKRKIRVDMVDTAGPAAIRLLWQTPGSGSFPVIPGTSLTPNYGLLTSETDADGKVSATEYSDAASGIGPHHGLATATVEDPAGLNLRTTTTYETPGTGSFLRRIARALPAGNAWTTTNYAGTEGPIAEVCGVTSGTQQGGMPKRVTGPDPDGGGPKSARVEEFVYDANGRKVGRRVGTLDTISSAGWGCMTHDVRGRLATQSWPAHDGQSARTVTYTYAVGGNPRVNRGSDSSWGSSYISATVDLLSRTTSYTDIWGNTTTTNFDLAGRQTSTVGPLGTITQNYSSANGRATTTTKSGTATPIASNAYEEHTGRLGVVTYGNGAATSIGFDTSGRPAGMAYFDNQGVTGETVTRGAAGRVKDQQVFSGGAFVDANTSGDNYLYDGAGRLTEARLPGTATTYGFGTSSGCTANTAGKNTNRIARVTTGTGAGSTNSCYNNADQLESTTQVQAANVTYDDHGNTTRLGDDFYLFDSADRHIRTETSANLTRYRRDPLDRIVQRDDFSRINHIATTMNAASGTTVGVSRPSGTQTGDLMVAAVSATALLGPGAISSSGWTVAVDRTTDLGRTAVLWRYAAAGDASSFNFTAASAASTTGSISTYRGPVPSAPIAVTATASTTLATTHPLPPVTTTSDAQHLVHVVGFSTGTNSSAPAGTTQRAHVNAGASLLVADRFQETAGASSALSATSTGLANSASITIALKPVTSIVRYGYAGHTDNSQFSKNTVGTITGYNIPLSGSTNLVQSSAGVVYMHANVHGDTISVSNSSGNRVWTGYSGPFGEATSGTTPPDNEAGTRWGWHGKGQRLTDRGIVQMGARPYSPVHGRFLANDPVEGGCANDYVYVFGDPVNKSDLSGKGFLEDLWCGTKSVFNTALSILKIGTQKGSSTPAPTSPEGLTGLSFYLSRLFAPLPKKVLQFSSDVLRKVARPLAVIVAAQNVAEDCNVKL